MGRQMDLAVVQSLLSSDFFKILWGDTATDVFLTPRGSMGDLEDIAIAMDVSIGLFYLNNVSQKKVCQNMSIGKAVQIEAGSLIFFRLQIPFFWQVE